MKTSLKSYLVRLHVQLASTPDEIDSIIDFFQLDRPKTAKAIGTKLGNFLKLESLYHLEDQWTENIVRPSTKDIQSWANLPRTIIDTPDPVRSSASNHSLNMQLNTTFDHDTFFIHEDAHTIIEDLPEEHQHVEYRNTNGDGPFSSRGPQAPPTPAPQTSTGAGAAQKPTSF